MLRAGTYYLPATLIFTHEDENIFEELDAPGEWFHDPKSGTLYFWPPEGLDLATATVESAQLRHLVEFRGTQQRPVRRVVLRGLTFCHAARTFMEVKEPLLRSDWTIYRGGAVVFAEAEDCGVVDCEFDQLGGNAVVGVTWPIMADTTAKGIAGDAHATISRMT